jgi:hypothetical protein
MRGTPGIPVNSGQSEAGNAEGAQGWAHVEAHAEGVASVWCGVAVVAKGRGRIGEDRGRIGE